MSRLIKRLRSLIHKINLLVSAAKISKLPHFKTWSETANVLIFLTAFSVKFEILICSATFIKNGGKFYIAVTTRILRN